MSAVAEISKPDTAVLFAAKREDLRLVWRPRYDVYGHNGQKVGQEAGRTVAFREGTLRIPADTFTFEDGRRTQNSNEVTELLEWLRGHKLFGDVHEGFTEVAQAAPKLSGDELAAITRATAQHDVDTLQAILAAELGGWERPDVVATVRESLETIERIKQEVRAQIEAEQAAAEVKPAPKRSAR